MITVEYVLEQEKETVNIIKMLQLSRYQKEQQFTKQILHFK